MACSQGLAAPPATVVRPKRARSVAYTIKAKRGHFRGRGSHLPQGTQLAARSGVPVGQEIVFGRGWGSVAAGVRWRGRLGIESLRARIGGGRAQMAVAMAWIGNLMAWIGNLLARIGVKRARMGGTMARIGNPMASITNPMARIGDPMAQIGLPRAR